MRQYPADRRCAIAAGTGTEAVIAEALLTLDKAAMLASAVDRAATTF